MSAWDVIVVGGGPGGSTAAWRLARAGKKVLVLDAATFPRVKLCAGWVTKQALADLEIRPGDYPHTIQPWDAVYFGVGDSYQETRWKEPANYGIIRKEFDTFLLCRAEAAGATVREGVRVRGVEAGRDLARVDAGREIFEAPVVVGAGGHTCPVARTLGEVSDGETVVLTQESETRIGAERLRKFTPYYGLPELFPEPDFKGYAWYVTKGDFLNIGVGRFAKTPNIHDRLDALLAHLRRVQRLPREANLTPFRGHAYSVRRRAPRQIAGERFVLVGDAAGLARDFSGEGIGPAVRSACKAAEVILGWIESGRSLLEYEKAVVALYGSGEENWIGRLASRLPESVFRALGNVVWRNSWLRKFVVH
ncbi:MAG: hypothetical protein A3J27_12880 [Candidatus Tectomicrobia bacterium RIFCSPLOWO2_12_FULL_69_37]|nr:MAG: hypothetical protein A3J27_12880 [Candidatus Tectomicrobia bacterium RIFCSPLOWO2_12_FULL_69_37]OGL64508.1 MAG: hypothetical protein A3I72_12965 [Candidatus Tectomicrobia bacterium RIFCSPLOWO2_02_FULL_70_19]